MGTAIVIILAVIIGAIWLFVKILEALGVIIDEVSKSLEAAAVRRKQNRYSKARDSLRQYVHTLIPNELDSFEKKLERTRTDFVEQAQELTNRRAHPPTWTKEEFQPLGFPHKDASYREMFIDEIDEILNPNPDSSTRAYKELEILNSQCKYPCQFPTSKVGKFTEFPNISLDLKEAVFEADQSHVSKKNVDRYFADEREKVSTYNNRRGELIAKTSSLNSAIEDWNKKGRIRWERYVAESKEMEDAELRAFQTAAELYIKACKEERSYFQRLSKGYQQGEKQCVIERLGFVLDRITPPRSLPHT